MILRGIVGATILVDHYLSTTQLYFQEFKVGLMPLKHG